MFEILELPHKSSILEDGIWTKKIGKVLNVSYLGFLVWISDLGTPKTMLSQVEVMICCDVDRMNQECLLSC